MDHNERLDILEQNGVIVTRARLLTEEFLVKLKQKMILDWEMESSLMFVTHTAVALDRMIKEIPMEDVPDELRQQIKEQDLAYQITVDLLAELAENSRMPLKHTEAEVLFIACYIKVLMKVE
jgi:transcriptional regulatory protein LevR